MKKLEQQNWWLRQLVFLQELRTQGIASTERLQYLLGFTLAQVKEIAYLYYKLNAIGAERGKWVHTTRANKQIQKLEKKIKNGLK